MLISIPTVSYGGSKHPHSQWHHGWPYHLLWPMEAAHPLSYRCFKAITWSSTFSLLSVRRPGMSQIRAVSGTWVLEWKRCTANPQWTWSMNEKLLRCILLRFQGLRYHAGFPSGSVVKNPPASAGNTGVMGWFPRSGRSPGGGNGTPPPPQLQYSCLENPMDRGAWRATVHRVAKSQIWLSNWTHTHMLPCSLS